MINKDDIKYEKIKSTKALVFMCPTSKFNMTEFNSLKKYIEDGQTVIFFSGEGGELKSGTNFNHLLE